jgi:restriction endonuclease Mrr
MRDPHRASSRHLCLTCVLGISQAEAVAQAVSSHVKGEQLTVGFSLTANGFLRFPPRVELMDVTAELYQALARDPDAIRRLSPGAFQELVRDRLGHFGYECCRVGDVNRKDGGVDYVAWQRQALVPTLLAVQAKHRAKPDGTVGSDAVRDLSGTIHQHGFSAGLLVTNTRFTADAQWVARKTPMLLQLRDMRDLQRWLNGEFSAEDEWREIPMQIELCPGVSVKLPR